MIVVAVIAVILVIFLTEGLYKNSIKHLEDIEWKIGPSKKKGL